MTKNATPAKGEAMPAATRRAVLLGLPAAAAAAMIPSRAKAAPTKASPDLKALIRTHRTTWQAFEDCCDAADKMHPNYAGPKAVRTWHRLNREERAAMRALLAFKPVSPTDHAARARYLLRRRNLGPMDLHQDALRLLLRSAL